MGRENLNQAFVFFVQGEIMYGNLSTCTRWE